MTLESLIDDARGEMEVTNQELDEARDRRGKIASALRAAFPGSPDLRQRQHRPR